MSATEWKTWCRLCGGVDGNELKLDTIESISSILQKYFQISITISEDCLSVVCQDCLDLVLNVEKFALRSVQVNKMILELLNDDISNDKVDSIRRKYGLFESEGYMNTAELKASENLPVDAVEFLEIQVTKDMLQTETKELDSDSISFYDEHNDDDVTYSPKNPSKSKKESNIDRQSKSKKRKLSTTAKATRSTTKKRKNITDPKPKSTKRKYVRGTDVWCHLCDTTFDLPRLYMEHMRGKHTPDVLPFACTECPKFFVSEKKLRQHSASHRPVEQKKIHPCSKCNRTFSRAENVQLHIRVVHLGERPFVCEECGKSWATKGALKQHQITHTEARPFKCSDCSKLFKDSYSLKKHSEIHDNASFECLLCGQRLNTRYTLREHMLVHSDRKRYECQYCGNTFKRYPTLKAHLIAHTGLRPYACPFCDLTFANRSNLRIHKKKCHLMELAAMEEAAQLPEDNVKKS